MCENLILSPPWLRPHERMRLRGKGGTRSPGSSLNALIPVRAYYSFDEREEAGSFEIDTVVHCGYGPQEGALWTLTLTDASNGFVYIRALRAKTQRYVIEALDDIAEHAPYPIKELHMDNGTEFKNFGFLQWCRRHDVECTRSRSYRKNDNCFVEAKNFTAVRSYVGYCQVPGGRGVLRDGGPLLAPGEAAEPILPFSEAAVEGARRRAHGEGIR